MYVKMYNKYTFCNIHFALRILYFTNCIIHFARYHWPCYQQGQILRHFTFCVTHFALSPSGIILHVMAVIIPDKVL